MEKDGNLFGQGLKVLEETRKKVEEAHKTIFATSIHSWVPSGHLLNILDVLAILHNSNKTGAR